MGTIDDDNRQFLIVTAGHHFLLRVLPFRHPESRQALDTFADIAAHSNLPFADVDAVLLRCLAVLNTHTGGRLPSLVDKYLASSETVAPGIARFTACVEDVLRYLGIGDPLVQQAIHVLNTRNADPALSYQSVASAIGVRPSRLCVAFKRQTGVTISEYLRGIRLEHAANLLVTTNKSIKEVWTTIGYNYPSNFDHDFKRQFTVTPREYRARRIMPLAPEYTHKTGAGLNRSDGAYAATTTRRVLIVDDDRSTCATVSRYLALEGYSVSTTLSGVEGLSEAERFRPDVILVDYRLGDTDGLSFLRAVRRHFSDDCLGVAIFSADLNLVDRSDEISALSAVFVSKLCDLDQIGQTVMYLLPKPRE